MSPAPMAEEGTSMAETAMMDERSRKRLMTEARRMQSAANGVAAHPVDGNLQLWHAIISGPADCCWEGGIFRLEMVFTSTYPLDPPRVKFLTRGVFHPNVYVSGDICLDVLKNNWSPTLSIEALLISIMSLLSDPNPNSPANAEAAQLYSNNPESYDAHVRAVVKASLDQEFSDDDEDDEESVDDGEEGDE